MKMIGRAKMCAAVRDQLRNPANSAMNDAVRPYLEPVWPHEYGVVLNEEIPPDRIVFVDNDGNLVGVATFSPLAP